MIRKRKSIQKGKYRPGLPKRVYLDFASATPIDPRVLEEYVRITRTMPANPSALHREGVEAHKALNAAHIEVAQILEVHSDEIVFTSGGTEGDNLALFGVVSSPAIKKACGSRVPHIIVSSVEHAAIIETAHALEQSGAACVTYLPVLPDGIVDLSLLKKSIRPETVLISIMYANNEIGTIQPIREIAKIIRHARKKTGSIPLFHTDATQAANYLPLRVPSLGVDLMTLNGSKIYGPRGAGILFVRRGVPLAPLMHGGVQESARRPGTENVAAAVAFARALSLTQRNKEKESLRLSKLQHFFFSALRVAFPESVVNGSQTARLPNNVHVTFPGFSSETIMLYLDAEGIAVSEKSACKSSIEGQSHVLKAIGRYDTEGEGGIRFSMGRSTTRKDIQKVILTLKGIFSVLGKK